ncbi:hypothetical protein Q8F55_004993 [Vanrija albida]|uniref:Solute carrier family 40 protein n=1 Tax=Vanrija albida TaxID=181172 RepID=A0ABR3Q0D7_9TREE
MTPAPPAHLRPFATAQRPSSVLFVGLNALRALSIIAMLLVLISNIVTIVGDAAVLKAAKHTNEVTSTVSTTSTVHSRRAAEFNTTVATSANNTWTCNYMQHSTIPSQTGGAFWSILNRTLVLIASEVGFPKTLFDVYLPMLSKGHGLGCLGALQAFLAASVLSHYSSLFPQVASWMLFVMGCLNMVVGIFLREKARALRSLFKWENYANLTPQTKVAASAWDIYSSTKEPSPSTAEKAATDTDAPYAPGSRFGGFAFGAQKAWRHSLQTLKISRPLETLPKHHM